MKRLKYLGTLAKTSAQMYRSHYRNHFRLIYKLDAAARTRRENETVLAIFADPKVISKAVEAN